MHLILALLISLSFPAMAEVYKWTDASGQVHFGNQPPPGKKQQIKIRDNSVRDDSGAESDIIRQARELEMRKQQKAQLSAEDRYRDAVDEIRSGQKAQANYVCTGVENRLKGAEENWQRQKLQGYSISDQNYHEQRIKDLERHRDNICR